MKHNLAFQALLLAFALVSLLITAGCIGTTTTPGTSFSGTGNGSIATELPAGVYTLTITQASAEMIDVSVETKETGIFVQGRYTDAAAASAKTADGWVWTYALVTDEKTDPHHQRDRRLECEVMFHSDYIRWNSILEFGYNSPFHYSGEEREK